MFRSLVILSMALFLLLTGCGPAQRDDVLTEDQMVDLMMDFYLREARLKDVRVGEDSGAILFNHFRKLYNDRNLTQDTLIDKSLRYYLADPVLLNRIYDRLIDSLALKEQKAGGSKPPVSQ